MKHIYIATSKISGKGIYAGETIKKGEIIQNIKGEIKFKINKNLRDVLSHPNWIGIAENEWIDPDKPYKFLNHSCKPNIGIKGRFCMIPLRDIKEGEEICIDYSIIEGDYRWEMECSCGNRGCRKIIRSIHFLPKVTFNRYFPFIASYFKVIYKKNIKLKNG